MGYANELGVKVTLGVDRVSMLNPPNDGEVIEPNGSLWRIGRNSYGLIVLRNGLQAHPDFFNGMDMASFCEWINVQFV